MRAALERAGVTVGLYGRVQPPSGPVDVEVVMLEQAGEWATLEIIKKRPSADPLQDILNHDAEMARLTRQRMDELAAGWE